MKKVNKKIIGEVIEGMVKSFDEELYSTPQENLSDRYYHFKWDDSYSVEYNTYRFHDMLALYSSFCRRWETHHNGYMCVVERVRDQYLMPKIREFLKTLAEKTSS